MTTLSCPPKSDFWVIPEENRHSGHFEVKETLNSDESFEASVQLQGTWIKQYDQGGIMLRISPTKWVKTGIENYSHNESELKEHISVVVTDPYSDWSITPGSKPTVLGSHDWLCVKISRKQHELIVQWSYNDDKDFKMIRQVPAFFLGNKEKIEIGLQIAAPTNDDGCKVTFKNWQLTRLSQ